MRLVSRFVSLGLVPALATLAVAAGPERFDVVIAGGSTAAFAAAVASAESGARTALIEPTDWVGGQITSSGVPAIDEAWHKVTDAKTGAVLNVSAIARDRANNMTPNFAAMLRATGNPGRGWVSNFCFLPQDFLDQHLLPLEKKLSAKLVVYRDTVPKRVKADRSTGKITALTAIQRTPRPGVAHAGYDRLPSLDLPDWYDPKPSDRFDKKVLTFEAPVFIDATEWGELLALANAPYLQGYEDPDGGLEGNDRCGQATVFDFVQRLHAQPVEEPRHAEGVEGLGFGSYSGRPDAWRMIWTYRRLKGLGEGPTPGDLSLQNWGYSAKTGDGGNDYPFGYLFLSRDDAREQAERDDWTGGIDLAVLAAAEKRALAWHDWFRNHPQGVDIKPGQVTLEIGALGTGHGLSKLPYIRDTRRSIGLDNFVLPLADLTGPASQETGKPFADRIAIGAYPADIHPLVTCKVPFPDDAPTLPFFIPFRALTNREYGNLLVAGKTMAQSFAANAATRLHPIEWSTGTASGVAAAHMAKTGRSTREVLDHVGELQALVREKTPIEWTIGGRKVPDAK
jgi:hypothetical protein